MARLSQLVLVAVLAASVQLTSVVASTNTTGQSTTTSSSYGESSGSSDANTTTARKDLLMLEARSSLGVWIDPTTPQDKMVYVSSRGDNWDLVMSDEFGLTNRSFKPGEDHLWTSLEKPDGVNGALEIYSHNMTSIVCDQSDENGTKPVCYLQIKTMEDITHISIYNQYTNPPGYQNNTFVSGLARSMVGWFVRDADVSVSDCACVICIVTIVLPCGDATNLEQVLFPGRYARSADAIARGGHPGIRESGYRQGSQCARSHEPVLPYVARSLAHGQPWTRHFQRLDPTNVALFV